MSDTYGLTRTLGVIAICTNPNGEPIYHIGNNSIIFCIEHEGRRKMLKCYTREKRNLRRIYGSKCLRDELYIHHSNTQGEWVDVVLDEWIEGETLYRHVINNLGDTAKIVAIAEKFNRFAYSLLAEDWAHGDLKPENIMVTPEGKLHLVDFDAMFLPEMEGETSDETGTATFQHPARNADYFDKSIDDYPIAIISTALHVLAADPSFVERYNIEDQILVQEDVIAGKSAVHDDILSIFAREGMALQYRIAQLLCSATPKLHGLSELLGYATAQANHAEAPDPELFTLDNHNGLWGYRCGEKFIIPPIYDSGFDFSEGVAAVCIGGYHHYIDSTGCVVLKCPQYEAIKPFRNGRATVIENGVRKEINLRGEEILVCNSKSY